jgi:hypothetical protein
MVLESQLHGARIAHTITSDVIPVICAKSNPDNKKLTKRLNVFKKINRERTNKFHIYLKNYHSLCKKTIFFSVIFFLLC